MHALLCNQFLFAVFGPMLCCFENLINCCLTWHISAVEEAADKLGKCEITEPTFSSPPPLPTTQSDPTKRLKNLKKKLREIELLEEKIKLGTLKNPDKEQKEKISKKIDIIKEINTLESTSEWPKPNWNYLIRWHFLK